MTLCCAVDVVGRDLVHCGHVAVYRVRLARDLNFTTLRCQEHRPDARHFDVIDRIDTRTDPEDPTMNDTTTTNGASHKPDWEAVAAASASIPEEHAPGVGEVYEGDLRGAKAKMTLSVDLTDQEITLKARELAEQSRARRDLKLKLASIRTDLNQQIKDVDGSMQQLSQQLIDGTAERQVECVQLRDERRQELVTVRLDTNVVVSRRPLSFTERQSGLFDGAGSTPDVEGDDDEGSPDEDVDGIFTGDLSAAVAAAEEAPKPRRGRPRKSTATEAS